MNKQTRENSPLIYVHFSAVYLRRSWCAEASSVKKNIHLHCIYTYILILNNVSSPTVKTIVDYQQHNHQLLLAIVMKLSEECFQIFCYQTQSVWSIEVIWTFNATMLYSCQAVASKTPLHDHTRQQCQSGFCLYMQLEQLVNHLEGHYAAP